MHEMSKKYDEVVAQIELQKTNITGLRKPAEVGSRTGRGSRTRRGSRTAQKTSEGFGAA